MKRLIFVPLGIFLFLSLVSALIALSPRFLLHRGTYQPPPAERAKFEALPIPNTEVPPAPKAFAPRESQGVVLLDRAHDNNFTLEEFLVPTAEIVSRGYELDFWTEGSQLEEKLRFVDALVVAVPQKDFTEEEVRLIKEFVAKGGRLVLLADPTRPSRINSIAAEFAFIFEKDYLYNLTENEGNFRNILIKDFKDHPVTRNVDTIALFSAGSITSPGWGVAFTDENTRSSLLKTRGRLSPIAVSPESRVLAVHDLTFLQEPFNTARDNSQLISNIADFLTRSRRAFYLSDFPYFFRNKVQVGFTRPQFFDFAMNIKNHLEQANRRVQVVKVEGRFDVSGDGVFLGLLEESEKVKEALESAQILVGGSRLEIEDVGSFDLEGSSFILRVQRDSGSLLILLADTQERLQELVDGLNSGDFREWLVNTQLALRIVPKPEEEKEALAKPKEAVKPPEEGKPSGEGGTPPPQEGEEEPGGQEQTGEQPGGKG